MKNKTDPRINNSRYNDHPSREKLPTCVICDLDGTLSLMNGRSPFDGHKADTDLVNPSVAFIVELMSTIKVPVFLFSGRNSDKGGLQATMKWLKDNHITYHHLEMRKPNDYRKDTVVKQEMFDEHIEGKYRVQFVLDDRDMMVDHWRDMGLDCFQVYYGNF